MLAFSDLQKAYNDKLIRFDPDIDADKQIAEASIDLRIGNIIAVPRKRKDVTIWPAKEFNPKDFLDTYDVVEKCQPGQRPTVRIQPSEYLLVFTHEEITVPLNLMAFVEGKSSIARAGLIVHCTAPLLNPGFTGRITLELCNHGVWDLAFEAGKDLICQVIFFSVDTPVPPDFIAEHGTYHKQAEPFPVRSSKKKKKR